MAASRIVVKIDEITNTCFVAMPFLPLFDAEYERVIKPAVELAGLNCIRGDEIYTRQQIVADIWLSMRRARLVIAELSDRNPNVMYEIGLAHAIGKPIVLLTRNEEDVPFDLRSLRYVYYDTNNPSWGADLRNEITRIVNLVLGNPDLASHLDGIDVETTLPAVPTQPVSSVDVADVPNLSGVWCASWLSIRRERRHDATLVIPASHGPTFTASMTVTYERESKQTIVQEALRGSLDANSLRLTGVNYSYVEQGSSAVYSLDSFELRPSNNLSKLVGKALLRHGEREVAFTRVQSSAV